ncbi:hypothetical protein J120_00610 [candidate division TM6 bacterium JCVI TM6SC1]|uniref:DNA polymerase I n=1 Tax=candidate division TM6 bacterium JCVI TM6SC1 TaxID=1306947 RepID=A0A0D2I2N7_9BACT|nr:hypothetical protein J120_00610 [candidate division TM6 bacterium JCVI TM6SC1]
MKLDTKNTLFIIDGSSFLYRAYYGIHPLHTIAGEPIHAVYSFCRMIKKLIDTFSPEYLALVWDSPGKTVRHDMYKPYKEKRQSPPSDLFVQKDRIREFASLIELFQYDRPGVEADDLMFSLAREWKEKGGVSVLITSDKDLSQALDEQTVIFEPFKEQFIDVRAREEKLGIPISKMPFYFALTGDSSDNIPGVAGVGAKTAVELVNQFDSLDDMYARIDQIPRERLRTLLTIGKDNAYISEKLFLLSYYNTGVTSQSLIFSPYSWAKARPLFEQLNFKSLLQDMTEHPDRQDKIIAQEQPLLSYDFTLITTLEQLRQVTQELFMAQACAFDTETDGLSPVNCELVGISLCTKKGSAYYIPCGHTTGETQLSKSVVLDALRPFLENPLYAKYAHHAKFDMQVLRTHGIMVKGVTFDTQIAASIVTPDWQKTGLKDLSLSMLGERMLTFKEVVTDQGYENFARVPLNNALFYAAADAHQTLQLKYLLERKLQSDQLAVMFDTIEMSVVPVLADMEYTGIYVDIQQLAAQGLQAAQALDILRTQISDMTGLDLHELNLNSPKQMQQLLFEKLKLPPQKMSAKKTGYSTDQSVLESLARLHPVPALILKYREISKLKNTYIDALPEHVNPVSGRIHTSFNQTIVATGRLSSSQPNLQNIPANVGQGLDIRAAFKPAPGYVFLSADYSQIELRIVAYLAQEPALISAFEAGADIHAQTAARLFDVSLEQVTEQQRKVGKRINFSILYGKTAFGLAQELGISPSQAKEYIDKYFKEYPHVRAWMDRIVSSTYEKGYVTTLWGRRRYLPAIYEKNHNLSQEAQRAAINTVPQGTAADLMKKSMARLYNLMTKEGLHARILLQIHDELLLEVPQGELERTKQIVKKTLESVVSWSVPLEVHLRTGYSWSEVTK